MIQAPASVRWNVCFFNCYFILLTECVCVLFRHAHFCSSVQHSRSTCTGKFLDSKQCQGGWLRILTVCGGGKKATSSGNSQSFIPKAVLSHLLLRGPWGCQWTISVSDIIFIQITDFSAVISQCAVTCSCFYILQLVTLVSHCTQHYTAADL